MDRRVDHEMPQAGIDDFGELVDIYGETVWKYAYFLTKKRDLADDIAQEVFIKAYRSLHAYRGEASLKTWLLKITRNTSYTLKNKAYLKYQVLVSLVSFTDVHPSAETSVLAREYSHEIWSKVTQLSNKYREAIVLNAHYQLSMEEIAELLQISVNTVKSRLLRARKELLKLMQGGAQDDDD